MTATPAHPRFSFLTPAYGTEAYLPSTIESVLAQTSPEWELVVVDNGNSDAISAIVESYAHDSRIRLVRQENRGYTGGVMAAAAVAHGDYLCVLDSDDQLMPRYVETVAAFLDADPDLDAVGCDAHLFVDSEERPSGRGYLHSTGTRLPSPRGERLTVADVLGGRVPYYTGAIRRDAWDAVAGYAPGVAGMDESVLIWLRLADRFRVLVIPHRLARYRIRETSLSRDPQKIEEFERCLTRTFEQFAQESGSPAHRAAIQRPLRRLRYHQALRRARWSFLDGDVPAARRFAREAFAYEHSARAAAVVASLAVAPRALSAAYPIKQRLAAAGRRLRPRIQA
jgi:glycosyltransferase involved in cell wall biosynthesis